MLPLTRTEQLRKAHHKEVDRTRTRDARHQRLGTRATGRLWPAQHRSVRHRRSSRQTRGYEGGCERSCANGTKERPGAGEGSATLAQCLLRGTGGDLPGHSPGESEPIPCKRPLTGEPEAENPPVRLGGRGEVQRLAPTPIRLATMRNTAEIEIRDAEGRNAGALRRDLDPVVPERSAGFGWLCLPGCICPRSSGGHQSTCTMR